MEAYASNSVAGQRGNEEDVRTALNALNEQIQHQVGARIWHRVQNVSEEVRHKGFTAGMRIPIRQDTRRKNLEWDAYVGGGRRGALSCIRISIVQCDHAAGTPHQEECLAYEWCGENEWLIVHHKLGGAGLSNTQRTSNETHLDCFLRCAREITQRYLDQ